MVERYYKQWAADEKWLLRLPQEDFCQAMNLPSSKKYQADNGPSILDCMRLLQGASDNFTDRLKFLKTQIMFLLLSAPDGHAKNFSVFLQAGDNFALTPVYDVISIYPINNKQLHHRAKLAMGWMGTSKGYRYKLQAVQLRHILFTAKKLGLLQEVEAFIGDISSTVESAIISTEKAAKAQEIDMTIALPILEKTRAKGDWLGASMIDARHLGGF